MEPGGEVRVRARSQCSAIGAFEPRGQASGAAYNGRDHEAARLGPSPRALTVSPPDPKSRASRIRCFRWVAHS